MPNGARRRADDNLDDILLKVLFATSELTPFVKTGGLADISAALPRALDDQGCRVAVILPGYPQVTAALDCDTVMTLEVLNQSVRILRARQKSPTVYLVASEIFRRPGGPYGDNGSDFADNALRFAVLAGAIDALIAHGRRVGCRVDILHLNDWPTALAAGLVHQRADRPRIVFSIHNLAYQGLFPREDFERLKLPNHWWSLDGVEFHGRLSFIKAGIVYADALTTVSRGYALEIQQPGQGVGLDGLLRRCAGKLHGITNGIDVDTWNPAIDGLLPNNYDPDDLEGKARNKALLQRDLGLEISASTPLLSFVGRLVEQKGIDLITGALPALLALPAQLVVLGTGEAHYATELRRLALEHPRRVAFVDGFDERLAHRIEAGADIFLMPSRFEPCGLNQMYSMRYGTVPVVRRTGGLADTVRQVWSADVGDGTGFLFDDPTPEALGGTLRPVVALYHDSNVWRRIQRNGMTRDFSWQASAERYVGLYRDLVGIR